MNTIKFLLAILFIIAAAGCGGGGGYGSGGGSMGYSISGTVSGGATNNRGVKVSLTGAATMNMTTAAGGAYSFGGLPNGSYVVTPTMTGATFTPASAPVTIYLNNPSGINFTELP